MELNLNKHKILASVLLILVILLVMIAIGYPLGILSEDPDGLEKVLIDQNGESWLEGLSSVWIPLLSWIENNYIAATIGFVLSVAIIYSAFKLISYKKGK